MTAATEAERPALRGVGEATRRPWRIAPIATWMIEDDHGAKIVECIGDGLTIEQDRANAALIVTAVNGAGAVEEMWRALEVARETFLALIADGMMDTDVDGDETGVTTTHTIVTEDLQLRDLMEALGFKLRFGETTEAEITRLLDEPPAALSREEG